MRDAVSQPIIEIYDERSVYIGNNLMSSEIQSETPHLDMIQLQREAVLFAFHCEQTPTEGSSI